MLEGGVWKTCRASSTIFRRRRTTFNKSLMRTRLMKRSCVREATDLELHAAGLAEVEKVDADKATEIAPLCKAPETTERRTTFWRRKPLPSAEGKRRRRPRC
ncbi:hypothetical protein ACSQ67_025044 [Phaseolus vulgaris]